MTRSNARRRYGPRPDGAGGDVGEGQLVKFHGGFLHRHPQDFQRFSSRFYTSGEQWRVAASDGEEWGVGREARAYYYGL
jgi:hypothetical protein